MRCEEERKFPLDVFDPFEASLRVKGVEQKKIFWTSDREGQYLNRATDCNSIGKMVLQENERMFFPDLYSQTVKTVVQ